MTDFDSALRSRRWNVRTPGGTTVKTVEELAMAVGDIDHFLATSPAVAALPDNLAAALAAASHTLPNRGR
jgi:hypothetical protein